MRICCAPDEKSLGRIPFSSSDDFRAAIDKAGKCHPSPPKVSKTVVYYSNIQFTGTCEPFSGSKGLDLLPNSIVYNGADIGIFEAFAHYRDNKLLHTYTAIFIEFGAIVAFDGTDIDVGGKGSVTVFCPKQNEPSGADFEMFNYVPGEKFRLAVYAIKV